MRKPGFIRRIAPSLLWIVGAYFFYEAATDISVAIYLIPFLCSVILVFGTYGGSRDRESAKRFDDYMSETTGPDETTVIAVHGYDLPVRALRTKSARLVVVEPTFVQTASESELRGAAGLLRAELRSDQFSGRPTLAATAIFICLFVLFSLLPSATGNSEGSSELIQDILLGLGASIAITYWLNQQLVALMTRSGSWLDHLYSTDREALKTTSELDLLAALSAMSTWADRKVASKSHAQNVIEVFTRPVKVKYVFQDRLDHLVSGRSGITE